MSNQVQVPNAGMIALGVFIAAFVLLMVIGHSFLAALIFAIVVAVAVAIFFLVARGLVHERGAASPASRPAGATSAAAPLASTVLPDPEPAPSQPKPAPAPEPAPAASAASSSAPEPAPAAPTGSEAHAHDQHEPERLDAPREGGADDLKRIKGIGPKIEETLHGMGVYHMDQIAGWGPSEVAWMDENLVDFRGRVSRDDWVGQARLLSGGGETEFSQRVDKGGVYE